MNSNVSTCMPGMLSDSRTTVSSSICPYVSLSMPKLTNYWSETDITLQEHVSRWTSEVIWWNLTLTFDRENQNWWHAGFVLSWDTAW